MPPEKKQTFDKKAKLYLSDLVFVKEVEIQPQDKDRYGRTVGLVYVGQRSVNEEMVKAGFAWVYSQYCMLPDCAGYLNIAQLRGMGGIGKHQFKKGKLLWPIDNKFPDRWDTYLLPKICIRMPGD